MNVRPIRTEKIYAGKQTLGVVLNTTIDQLEEASVVAISSKIVSLCEGRVVPIEGTNKEKLIYREADYFLPTDSNAYGFHLTITRNTLVAAAGIDASNAGDNYVLWPADPQKSANEIRAYLRERFKLKKVGVIILDSVSTPLRLGTSGAAIAFSGFKALRDYRGSKDIFGRTMLVSRAGIATGLAAAAVVAMGEGDEQTPIAVITDVPFVEFVDRDPTPEDLALLSTTLDDDLYGQILKKSPWQKGGSGAE